jgi:hypothetical protein
MPAAPKWADGHNRWARERCLDQHLWTITKKNILQAASKMIESRVPLRSDLLDLDGHISSLVRDLEAVNGRQSLDVTRNRLEWLELQQAVS